VNAGEDVPAGFYPEREATAVSLGDRAWSSGVFWVHQLFHRRIADPASFAGEVARHAARVHDRPLDALVPDLRYRLRRAPVSSDLLAECFGLYLAALERAGAPAAAPAAPVVLGAARVLVEGGIVELAGAAERQSTLALAAAAMALRGAPVHLLTASEPRASVLAEVLRAPLAALGIGVGVITPGVDGPARYKAYANLVVCGALRDVGFDYLRDQMVLGGRPRRVLGTLDRLSGDAPADRKLLLPGMRCALIDEADRVMLDDSRVPLAVSTEADQSSERLTYEQALELARALHDPADFSLGPERTELTPQASQRLAQLTQALGGVWAGRERREELIALALDALHIARRDRDYRVIQGRVVFAPRPAQEAEETSAAQQLLQKLIEVKEGCRLSGRRVVLAQMTAPRMLGRYLHLAGACGDARGLEHEFWRLYRLKTVLAGKYPQPIHWSARLFATAAAKRDALMECVRAAARAIVIALRSPAEAQALLEACAEAGIKVGLVRGAVDAAEQQAVADLATSGTVIITLYPGERTVSRAPINAIPPHLIVAELHDAERHIAHIARAYGADSCEILVSLEDDALKTHLGPRVLAAAARAAGPRGEAPPDRARRWVSRALRSAERAVALARRDAVSVERNLDDLLAFSGQRE
jgi:preprotein translocase subunit SecA